MKKALPEMDPGVDRIFMLPYYAVQWEALKTAIRLNIFDLLSTPSASADVAAALSAHPQNTEHLLNALVAMDAWPKGMANTGIRPFRKTI